MKRSVSSLFACILLAGSLGAVPASAQQDDLLLADTPIFYGEDAFLARLEARTGGERAPVGLVLSGGSARAFAHIGVLRRLEEAGVVPDFIVANSMGSIIGLLYAAGLSPDQIYDLVSSTSIGALFDPTVPLSGGILDPSRFSDLLRLYLGDLRLEDLPIPIIVACEDLVTKREILLAEGDFTTVMEAAYALPVFFPPVAYGDHMLIDGGITNLVPLGLAMDFSDTVIVSSTFYDATGLNLRNPLIVLNTSIDIGKRRAGVVDLLNNPGAIWIRCGVESYSFMAFDRLDELSAEGYRSADATADRFAGLASGGVDAGLEAARLGYDLAIADAGASWAPFERAPSRKLRLAVTPTIRSTAYPGDRYYLSDSLFGGASLGLRAGPMELSLDGGGEWAAYTDGALSPALAASGRLYVAPWLRLEGFLSARWTGGVDSGIPELYQRSGVTAARAWDGGRLELSSRLERDGIGVDDGTTLLSSGADLTLDGEGAIRDFSFGFGHQLSGDWDEHYAYATAGMLVMPAPSLALRFGGLTRAALDPDGNAPLFLSDPLSVAVPSVVDGVGRVLLGTSISAGWEPERLAFSFAELIIMRRLSLALYGDAAWAGADSRPSSLVTGLRAGCELSLIGLKSARFLLDAGRDIESGEYFVGLYLSPVSGR